MDIEIGGIIGSIPSNILWARSPPAIVDSASVVKATCQLDADNEGKAVQVNPVHRCVKQNQHERQNKRYQRSLHQVCTNYWTVHTARTAVSPIGSEERRVFKVLKHHPHPHKEENEGKEKIPERERERERARLTD